MTEAITPAPNTLFIEVSGSGLPEVDGLYVPSKAPPTLSESGTVSSPGYWNGKLAWDRADGRSARSPALSYSNTYKAWRLCRLDGHLAYEIGGDDALPPVDRPWNVYKMGVAPAPRLLVHAVDPRQARPSPNIVFILGGPGAGKGTMCELAEIQLGWSHLSAGALLRAEQAAGGPTAALIEEILATGKLVPSEISVGLLKQAVEQIMHSTGKRNFLIDGFPRSLDNLQAWREAFGGAAELPTMVYFECPFEVLEKRILSRARFTDRADDSVEAVKLRFDTFKDQTLPTVEFFKRQGKCVEIDTSLDRETVYAKFRAQLAPYTDSTQMAQALCERSEILLGLRPYPRG
ncbi:MAG: nucleoside monophosphate kinase [Inhella sp.]